MWSDWLQLTQAPVQETLQQTPSLQAPDRQSPGSSQMLPEGRLAPQAAPEQQTPSRQVAVVQSPSQAHSWPGARRGALSARQVSGGARPPSTVGPAPGASRRSTLEPEVPPTTPPTGWFTGLVEQPRAPPNASSSITRTTTGYDMTSLTTPQRGRQSVRFSRRVNVPVSYRFLTSPVKTKW